MASVFTVKKLSYETLGEYLRSVRQELKLAVNDVCAVTGIPSIYLRALESGNVSDLPPAVYMQGLLRQLAEYYQIPEDWLVEQYRKELLVTSQSEVVSSRFSWEQVINLRSLSIALIAFLAVAVISTVVWQLVSLNRPPKLIIYSPQPQELIQSGQITISGETDPGATVRVNGSTVSSASDGRFQVSMAVAQGPAIIRVESVNRIGQVRELELPVQVNSPNISLTSDSLSVDLETIRETSVIITQDGIELPEELLPPRTIKKVVAKEKVVVSTPDAGAITAKVNGQSIGVLGRVGEPVIVPITKDASTLLGNPINDKIPSEAN